MSDSSEHDNIVKFKSLDFVDPYNPNPNEAQLLSIIDRKLHGVDDQINKLNDDQSQFQISAVQKILTIEKKLSQIDKELIEIQPQFQKEMIELESELEKKIEDKKNCSSQTQEAIAAMYVAAAKKELENYFQEQLELFRKGQALQYNATVKKQLENQEKELQNLQSQQKNIGTSLYNSTQETQNKLEELHQHDKLQQHTNVIIADKHTELRNTLNETNNTISSIKNGTDEFIKQTETNIANMDKFARNATNEIGLLKNEILRMQSEKHSLTQKLQDIVELAMNSNEKIDNLMKVNRDLVKKYDDIMINYNDLSTKHDDLFNDHNALLNDYESLSKHHAELTQAFKNNAKFNYQELYDLSVLTRTDVDEIAKHIDLVSETSSNFSKDVIVKMQSLSARIDYLEDNLPLKNDSASQKEITLLKQRLQYLEKKFDASIDRFAFSFL
jgi:chromosome segregation ATPase